MNTVTGTHVNRYCDAFLSAVENARDAGMDESLATLDAWAHGYIADGMSACTCPTPPPARSNAQIALDAAVARGNPFGPASAAWDYTPPAR